MKVSSLNRYSFISLIVGSIFKLSFHPLPKPSTILCITKSCAQHFPRINLVFLKNSPIWLLNSCYHFTGSKVAQRGKSHTHITHTAGKGEAGWSPGWPVAPCRAPGVSPKTLSATKVLLPPGAAASVPEPAPAPQPLRSLFLLCSALGRACQSQLCPGLEEVGWKPNLSVLATREPLVVSTEEATLYCNSHIQ